MLVGGIWCRRVVLVTLTVSVSQLSPSGALEAELEQVRRRLLVAEQQLREERRRVAALENGPPYPTTGNGPPYQTAENGPSYQATEHEPGSPTYHETIKVQTSIIC